MKNLYLAFSVLFTALLVSGCGGSSNNNTSSTAPGAGSTVGTQTFGRLTVLPTGTLQPATISTGGSVTATGVAGATINSLVQTIPVSASVPASAKSDRIAFSRYDGSHVQIYTISPTAGESSVVQITSSTNDSNGAAFSPDGTKIAFYRFDGNHNQIYTETVAGGESSLQQITNSNVDSVNPVFSPDGSRIAFLRTDGARYQVYTISSAGIPTGGTEATLQPVTSSTTQNSYNPAYSPDGSKIAFFRNDGISQYQIYTISAAGGESTVQKLTNYSPQGSFSPTFSPDGTKIAFFRYDGSHNQIYTETVAGGESSLLQITNNVNDSLYPRFSPDGSRITFQRYDGISHNQAYTISATGGESTLKQVTSNTAQNSNFPAWGSIAQVNLVGTGGTLGTSGAGFLFTQTAMANPAVLVFDTASVVSRAGARITALTNVSSPTSPNLLFQITVPDAISRLAFQNSGTVQTPIISTGSATGALVYVKSTDGTITNVLPFAPSAGTGGTPTATRNTDGSITITGRILGNFDANGQNSLPNGAGSVNLPAQ